MPNISSITFQFQLVRLKSHQKSRISKPLFISIPTGSIKIKSFFDYIDNAFKFQFQLVRLKSNKKDLI